MKNKSRKSKKLRATRRKSSKTNFARYVTGLTLLVLGRTPGRATR